jgi:hypothetical protein
MSGWVLIFWIWSSPGVVANPPTVPPTVMTAVYASLEACQTAGEATRRLIYQTQSRGASFACSSQTTGETIRVLPPAP